MKIKLFKEHTEMESLYDEFPLERIEDIFQDFADDGIEIKIQKRIDKRVFLANNKYDTFERPVWSVLLNGWKYGTYHKYDIDYKRGSKEMESLENKLNSVGLTIVDDTRQYGDDYIILYIDKKENKKTNIFITNRL